MNIHDIYPSKYLKARDLDGREPVVTIRRVEMTMVNGDRKPVCVFDELKPLILNRTNCDGIAAIAGDPDTDSWPGVRVRLVIARVSFQGAMHDAIRVGLPPPVKRAAKTSDRSAPADAEPGDDTASDDLAF